MARLYNVDSPITREQRNNLNLTLEDIQRRFNNVSMQISVLTGGEDVEAIIESVQNAIDNANVATSNTQQALQDISNSMDVLQTAIDNANDSADNANQTATDIRNEIVVLQNVVNELGNASSYSNTVTYQKNNVVEYNGSSYMAKQVTTGNVPPVLPAKSNDYWQMLAQRGVDGTGSVSSVSGISPDINGNVELTPLSIGAANNEDFQSWKGEVELHFSNAETNAKDNGVTGDGVTNDTTALQSVIDNLHLKGGGIVVLPKGSYIVDNLIIPSNVHIKGFGIGVTTIKQSDGSNRHFIVNSDTNNGNNNISISNLTIDGNKGAQGDNYSFGVFLDNTDNTFLQNIEVINCLSHGIDVRNSSHATIDNVISKSNNGHGINFSGVSSSIISKSKTDNNDKGVNVEGGSDYIKISNCISTNNSRSGFSIPLESPSTNVSLLGNSATTNGFHGFEIQGNGAIVIGNIASGNGTVLSHQGIMVNARNVIVSDNAVFNNAGVGIDLGNCDSVTVKCNNVYQNKCYGIECNSSDNVIIEGNTVTSNSQDNPSMYSGIIVYASEQFGGTSDKVAVVNNTVKKDAANMQLYGIEVRDTANDVIVSNNIVINSGTAGNIFNGKSSTIVKNNIGFTNESNVTGYVDVTSIGTKNVIIQHGLNYVPDRTKITATIDANGFNDFLAFAPMLTNLDATNLVFAVFVQTASSTAYATAAINARVNA